MIITNKTNIRIRMTLKKILRGILRRYLHTTINKLHYLRLDIDSFMVTNELEKIKIEPKELTYEDFLKGDKAVFDDVKLALYKERLNGGKYKAYGVVIDEKLAYSSWISYEKIGMPVETKTVLLKSNEGYFEDDHCAPEFRGRGIHTQMLWYRMNELIKIGRNVAVITIMDGNIPALKPAYKCGFKDLGTFMCGEIFGKKYNTLNKEKYESR